MAVNEAESYLDHPMFQGAMQSIQKGKWESGLNQIETLMQAYPLEPELRSLRQEIILRAKVDADERVDVSQARKRRFRDLTIRGAIIAVLIILAVFVANTYSDAIRDQYETARTNLEAAGLQVQLQAYYRDAQDLLRAGQPEQAIALLENIEDIDPDYQDLDVLMEQAKQLQFLNQQYSEALDLVEQGELTAALLILEEIEKQDPYYRDVRSQIQTIQDQTILGEQLKEADRLFDAEQWEEAANAYYSLYSLNPDYQIAHVEDRLFTSYVNAAEEKLANSDSLEAIQDVEEYIRNALALRPQDPEVKKKQAAVRAMIEEKLFWSYVHAAQTAIAGEPNSLEALKLADQYFTEALRLKPSHPEISVQRELAHNFISAQQDFITGVNSGAIEKLELVYTQDPGYAKGTARQTLYEAYVAKGDDGMAIGDFDSALEDYQRAAVLANEDPSSKGRLYEIQMKLAEDLGLLGDYESAVRLYRAAFILGDLQARAQRYSSAMATALASAEQYESAGNLREAFRYYREAGTWATQVLDVVTHVVNSGEYLSSLALEYNSTVSLIAEANNLANPNMIITGQELIIPILP
jgi:tetratricopeptide (TPR) repeat protein